LTTSDADATAAVAIPLVQPSSIFSSVTTIPVLAMAELTTGAAALVAAAAANVAVELEPELGAKRPLLNRSIVV
jgi:hypothetical protein